MSECDIRYCPVVRSLKDCQKQIKAERLRTKKTLSHMLVTLRKEETIYTTDSDLAKQYAGAIIALEDLKKRLEAKE